jgi:hypothetical protein
MRHLRTHKMTGKALRFVLSMLLAAGTTCALAQLTGTTIVTNRVAVAPSSSTSWTDIVVACPAGMVAISGGIDTNDFSTTEVTTLAPLFAGARLAFQLDGPRSAADGWSASVKNYDSTAHPVTLMAVCGSLPNVVVNITSSGVSDGTVAAGGTGTAFTNCPSGYTAVGGGIDDSSPGTMKISALAPTYQSQFLIERPAGLNGAPTGWSGSIRSEGAAGQMKVATVCAQLAGVFSIVTGPFNIGQGTVSGLSAQCPGGSTLLSGGIDSNEVRRNSIAVTTALFGTNPQFPVDRPSGSYQAASGWYGIFYNYGPGTTTGSVAAVCASSSTSNVVVVYEFYNTTLRHYFRTASAAEANAIDHGSAGPGWVRTGDDFLAYLPQSNSPGSDVCRFYTSGANSHFYTAFQSECESLKSPSSGWTYEGLSFRIQLPSAGACPSGTRPVYRLYNNRFQFNDSNHRFTTLPAEAQSLQSQGWTLEGVAFCALAT